MEIKAVLPNGVNKYNLSLCLSYHVQYSTELQFGCFIKSVKTEFGHISHIGLGQTSELRFSRLGKSVEL